MAGRPWTDDEIKYLEENYGKVPLGVLAQKIGRKAARISSKVCKLRALGEWKGPENGYNRRRKSFGGCDKNCFECQYDDCMLPTPVAAYGIDIDEFI